MQEVALPLVALLLVVPVLVAVARTLFVPGITVDDLLLRTDLSWPRGVQEAEPVPWRLDLLKEGARRPGRLGPAAGSRAARRPAAPRATITSRPGAARRAGR